MNPRSNPLTKEKLLKQLQEAEKAIDSFPRSYYCVISSGDRFGEAILKELEICRQIMGEHYRGMLNQDARNPAANHAPSERGPSKFNTKYCKVPAKQ